MKSDILKASLILWRFEYGFQEETNKQKSIQQFQGTRFQIKYYQIIGDIQSKQKSKEISSISTLEMVFAV